MLNIPSKQQSTVLGTLKDLDHEHKRLNINSGNEMDKIRRDILASIRQIQQSIDEHQAERSAQVPQVKKQPLIKHPKKAFHFQGPSKEDTVQLGTSLSSALLNLREEGHRLNSEQSILNSLYFETLGTRFGRISVAHHRTFDWLLSKDQDDAPFNPKFTEWLERKQGVYWIAGKAGSGKSTLMKFLGDNNPLVLQALKTWSSPRRLITAAHYFWNAGTPEQKSQEGLLRSLLYDILRQCPDLMPLIASSRWSSANSRNERSPWNRQELLDAFIQVSARTVDSARFCFFVDGLDEYAGEHADIVSVLSRLADSEAIKICLSSRPWNVFENAFGKSIDRKLLLQDFNAPDIQLYVKDMLEADDEYLQLKVQDDRYEQLSEEIVDKAQGVFLWVFLVVRSLRRGLTNADTLLVLQNRLRQFPTDLRGFYTQMVVNIEDVYHKQMAQSLQIAVTLSEPSSVLLYSYLDQEDESYAERLEIQPWNGPEIVDRCNLMGRRLNARCADLLEVFCDMSLNPISKYKVDFLHRTVRDFLLGQDMQELLARRMELPFDVRAYLCRALLAQIKLTASLMPNHDMNIFDKDENRFYSFTELTHLLSKTIDSVLDHVREMEISRGRTESSIMDEVERVILIRKRLHPNSPPAGLEIEYRKTLGLDSFNQQGWLLAKAIRSGLTVHVKQKLEDDARYSKGIYGRPPLHYAMQAKPISIDMVRLLIEHGASPNQEYAGTTPWSQLVGVLQHVEQKHSADANGDWCEIIGAMINAGAKPYHRSFDEKDAATVAIRRVCTPSDAARLSSLLEHRRTSERFGRLGISKFYHQMKAKSVQKA